MLLVEGQKILTAPLSMVKIRLAKDDKYTSVGSIISRRSYLEVSIYARDIAMCVKDRGKIVLFDTCRPWD